MKSVSTEATSFKTVSFSRTIIGTGFYRTIWTFETFFAYADSFFFITSSLTGAFVETVFKFTVRSEVTWLAITCPVV
jgi:hypothetical protein